MSTPFWRGATVSALTLAVLLVVAKLQPVLSPVIGHGVVQTMVQTMSLRGLNDEDRTRVTAGYYQDLINGNSRIGLWPVIQADPCAWDRKNFIGTGTVQRRLSTFVYFDYKPNFANNLISTNSQGMADVEYALVPPPATRRIALLGDSISRGLGVSATARYEALLKQQLNQMLSDGTDGRRRHYRHYEILDFAVDGYLLTQMVDTAIDRASAFRPDVYMVALTDLSLGRSWSYHIVQLFLEGMDLKYDYLKEVARDARLGPADDARVLEAKLAPFRLRVVRAALSLLQRHAQQHGTDLIVLYMTSVNDPEKLARQFDDIAPILDELDIPKINLADTFGARDDLSVLRIAPGNVHPNAAGHRLLFESLYAKITESPRLRRIVLGDDAGSASDTPGTYARAGS